MAKFVAETYTRYGNGWSGGSEEVKIIYIEVFAPHDFPLAF